MKNTIFCQATEKGMHSFYLVSGGKMYFLFSQNYRKGVQSYFGRGVMLDEAIDFKKSHKDASLVRTMDKIPMYVKYIESEYNIAVFDRTKSRRKMNNRNTEASVA